MSSEEWGTSRINKIKLEGARVEISGKKQWGAGNEREWTQRTCEDPAPEFPAALAKLPPLVRDLLELPPTWAEGAFKVISVSLSWSETTRVRGASICLRADLECAPSPLIINTPHLPFAQYAEGGTQPVMPDTMIDVIEEIERHAEEYLAGKRAQEDLFDPARSARDRAAGEASETTILGQATDDLVRQVAELVGLDKIDEPAAPNKGRKKKPAGDQPPDDKAAPGDRPRVVGTADDVVMA